MQEYSIDCNSRFRTRAFGEKIFDDVCLDWKPDVVVDIRDFWMQSFIDESPLRQNI